MLQTFEQIVFLKTRGWVVCECSSRRAVFSDFSAIWRTFYELQGTGSIICVATHIVIREGEYLLVVPLKLILMNKSTS